MLHQRNWGERNLWEPKPPFNPLFPFQGANFKLKKNGAQKNVTQCKGRNISPSWEEALGGKFSKGNNPINPGTAQNHRKKMGVFFKGGLKGPKPFVKMAQPSSKSLGKKIPGKNRPNVPKVPKG